MPLPPALAALQIPAPSTPVRVFAGTDATIYLRAESKEAMDAAFAEAGIEKPQGIDDFYWPGVGNISIIGIIYNDDGEYDYETDTVIKAPTAKPGWHVNVLP